MYLDPLWTPWAAVVPLLSTIACFIFGLYLLAYPPPAYYKKLSVFLLMIPVGVSFLHYQHLSPYWLINDTFARFLYIWLAHMSYEVNILEFTPTLETTKENVKDKWKTRVKQAWKVMYNRHHTQVPKAESTGPQGHSPTGRGLSRARFVFFHAGKAALFMFLQWMWDVYQEALPLPQQYYSPERAYFFRRLFSSSSSLEPLEMYVRFEMVFDWTIISMLYYETVHSLFAVLIVGILQFDAPGEWSLSLCNSLLEAWSVRRYWGKHWHNYIYISFCSHAKIVSREWLGLKRGEWCTRLVENSLVFLASGLAHTLVRWRSKPGVDAWCITIWYVAQMLPMVVETLIQDRWRKARQSLEGRVERKRLDTFEKVMGYIWVTGWFLWSIPKFVHTRNAWRAGILEKRAAAQKLLQTVS